MKDKRDCNECSIGYMEEIGKLCKQIEKLEKEIEKHKKACYQSGFDPCWVPTQLEKVERENKLLRKLNAVCFKRGYDKALADNNIRGKQHGRHKSNKK